MKEFNYKKRLGQNFLQDENILKRIVSNVKAKENDLIIEIGPGAGALTKYLVQFDSKVLAFEIDVEVKKYLDNIKASNLKVIYQDFMKINLAEEIDASKYEHIYVVANIPYYITSPIIEHIIDSKLKVDELVLMVQKEVADRMSAKPGSKLYAASTVYYSYFYDIIKLFDVPKRAFYPTPKVDSAIIKLTLKKDLPQIEQKKFFKFIRDAFQFKRKNLRNNLKQYDLNKIEQVLNAYGHNLNNRAEDISLEEFIDIYNGLIK